ncbi:glutamine-rich protein 2 isoform X2 [Fukomys damarensis]|uniref:glutamine-rich protein 2 isoform X2 n=1 Tax=Fukomys damarensis TaxID=885580 RepID=UPI001455001E|nr:glutamine-rich protein 2 isoform X2 [Fukomys damarensis]
MRVAFYRQEYMGQKLTLVPSREEVTMVTWEELEKAITDGWKASQVGSETAVGVSKRKMQSSLTSDLISSGVSTKYASTDHIPDSAGGPGQALPGSSATGHLFEAIAIRDRSKGSFIPGREQHPRAHDEANTSRFYQPPVAQFRTESDPHRSRERFTSGYPRREMHTSPTQQELPWARDQPSGQGQVYLRPDHQELGLPGMDQLGPLYPGPIPPDVLPVSAGQLGTLPPQMDGQGLVPLSMDQHGVVPPSVPGRDHQGSGLPSADELSMVPLGPYQYSLVLPGTDQCSTEQPGMQDSDVRPHGTDQHGFVILGMDQQGLVPPAGDQQGPESSDIQQRGLSPAPVERRGLVSPGLIRVRADQQGFLQPHVEASGFIQPGTEQQDLIQPDRDHSALGQPGTYQPGLAQPGADQRGSAQPGKYPPGLVQPGKDQDSLVQPGVDQHGLVQPSAVQHGSPQPGVAQLDVAQQGADQRGSIHPEVGRYDLMQPGAYPPAWAQAGADSSRSVQPGIGQHSLVQPGMDQRVFVQPGAVRHGLVQPGQGQFGMGRPGMDQRALVQPGASQRGLAQPGAGQIGVVPPGTDQHGLAQPTIDQHGLAPPGADQGGLAPPGAEQRDLAPPGADQSGLAQPGAEQHGLVPPGVNQRDLAPPGTGQFGVLQPGIGQPGADPQGLVQPALETFRLMGELIGLYMELKESLKDLDEEKSGQTDAEKIQYLFTQMVKKILPPDLQEQMKTIKALAKEVHQEKAKVEKMQRILEGDGEQVAGKELKAGQLGLQLGLLRITITDIEKELADLRDSQEQGKAAMENSVAEASLYLQDQLDKLRMIIESMLASSSTLLSLSMTPHKPLTVLAPGQIHPEATCPACSLDLSHQVSTLVQRYEQLQEMVSNLAASRPSRKAKLQSQDEELLGHVQSAILQVQGDCEKLNITTSNLLEDHRQKQKDIDVLYQGLEKLEKNANREHLQMEIDVKADKSALASKVSRVEFDAATEQLNHMMQGLMAKLSGQERDWQKLLDKLLAEMDMKLDRLELDPVKQALEDRWKSLREQLKEHSPLYQADEAAAMRRQLLAHFHCLSCDRPLETPVTGQIIPVTPVGHPLPGHRSTRPYTVFELEQVRQQSRNLKLGSCFPRGDQSPMEQSVGHLRTMHSKMLLDIEKVQIHFGGSVKASSQMIRELRQAHCLSSPCFKRVPDSADYTYSTMSRRCGGSHTLTYPYRRNRLQHPSQGAYAPENQIAMKHDEVDILGLDGHIYKGRMDTRLPGILTKDREHPASGMMKYKAKQCRPRGNRQQPLSDNSQLPSRPQSAQMLAGNNSVSSRQQQDRPVSSAVDPLAQSDMAPPPSPNLQGSLPGELERNTDMLPPGEGLEEPTRGPRSTTGQ